LSTLLNSFYVILTSILLQLCFQDGHAQNAFETRENFYVATAV